MTSESGNSDQPEIGFKSPPSYPVVCMTNETPPRRIKLLGTALIDPDVWVGEIEGEADPSCWVVKGSGGICHKTADVHKARALPWGPPHWERHDL
jgi:hypothetical protein